MTKNEFREIEHSGLPPSKRGYHSAVLHEGKVVLMGGYDGKNHHDDTYVLEIGAAIEILNFTSQQKQ